MYKYITNIIQDSVWFIISLTLNLSTSSVTDLWVDFTRGTSCLMILIATFMTEFIETLVISGLNSTPVTLTLMLLKEEMVLKLSSHQSASHITHAQMTYGNSDLSGGKSPPFRGKYLKTPKIFLESDADKQEKRLLIIFSSLLKHDTASKTLNGL